MPKEEEEEEEEKGKRKGRRKAAFRQRWQKALRETLCTLARTPPLP
jgi:hypothetical protein